ncbi:MAG: cytochrome c oxidase subunit II [Candidatus Heimdallarchaeota archaeon]|nr:cytochrome c oxidase subunit II [Candidatus Heimdallarchaeota archaeon]
MITEVLAPRKSINITLLAFLTLLFSILKASGRSNYTENFEKTFLLQVILSFVVIILVVGLMLAFVFKYRDDGSDREPEEIAEGKFEVTWTLFAVILVLIIFFTSAAGINAFIDANDSTPYEVIRVEGKQFDWTFYIDSHNVNFTASMPGAIFLNNGTADVRYSASQVISNATLLTQYESQFDGFLQIIKNPNTGKYYQALVVEVGEAYRYEITSEETSVIHSFFVNDLSFKADALPGSVNTVTLTIEEAGTYWGACAELCGVSHYDMLFAIIAV